MTLLQPERTRSAYLAAHPPRRAPFPHESHVDFGAMDRVFNRARSEAVRVFKRHRSRLIVTLVDAVAALLLLGDRGGLGSLPTQRTGFDRDLYLKHPDRSSSEFVILAGKVKH